MPEPLLERVAANEDDQCDPQRDQRDSDNAKVMADPRMADMMDPKTMPFDGMRMFWGGFRTIVEL